MMVHMHWKILLAIIKDEELASSSLCYAVGGKNKSIEV